MACLSTRPGTGLRRVAAAVVCALSALSSGSAGAQPGNTAALHWKDGQAAARSLAEATRQVLLAVGSGDLVSACPGKPRPKLNAPVAPAGQQLAREGAASTGLAVGPVEPWGQACDPGGHHSVQAGILLLQRMAALKTDAPQLAAALTIRPNTEDEARRLSRGLALVLGSMGRPGK
jgi:hypothetical protein